MVPKGFDEDPDMQTVDCDVLRLMTMRSDDQFNTTIYTLDDRFRGIFGTRKVLLMNAEDIDRLGLTAGERVTALTVASDDVPRSVGGLRVTLYDIPKGCIAGYFPECNPLIPLWHHAEGSYVPAAKSIPVRLRQE
jgi:formate dehydrogenase major subunit